MKQSDTKLDKDKTSCLPIRELLFDITKPLSLLTASELKAKAEEVKQIRKRAENLEKSLIYAINSMGPMAADKCKYKHICKKCKSSGHGKVDCKITEAV